MILTPLALHHAPLLHRLYEATPGYFGLLGSELPTLNDVQRDVEIALLDPRRKLELLYEGDELVGSLDFKVDYPDPGDLTINLLLIREDRQGRGLGERAVRELEAHPPRGTRRILASVLGDNPRGARFWERLGYTFTLDARPAMTWYAKTLDPQESRPGPHAARLGQPLSAATD